MHELPLLALLLILLILLTLLLLSVLILLPIVRVSLSSLLGLLLLGPLHDPLRELLRLLRLLDCVAVRDTLRLSLLRPLRDVGVHRIAGRTVVRLGLIRRCLVGAVRGLVLGRVGLVLAIGLGLLRLDLRTLRGSGGIEGGLIVSLGCGERSCPISTGKVVDGTHGSREEATQAFVLLPAEERRALLSLALLARFGLGLAHCTRWDVVLDDRTSR